MVSFELAEDFTSRALIYFILALTNNAAAFNVSNVIKLGAADVFLTLFFSARNANDRRAI